MSIQVRPAARKSAKPLVGLYALSGAGKTYTALLLARGYVGAQGRIIMIETESGRGESYADPREYPEFAGQDKEANYQVISLHDDFSPKAYGEAIAAAEKAGCDALIIDSASHEWEGVGGVLDMADKNDKAGKKGPLVWQQPKIDHKKYFMLKFMQTPIPLVIVCMRGKYPMVQRQKTGGAQEWARSEVLEPIQAGHMPFEIFLKGYLDAGHKFLLTKNTSRALASVFADGQAITAETGRKFAAWARGDTIQEGAQSGAPAPTREAAVEQAKAALRDAASQGMGMLTVKWEGMTTQQRKFLQPFYDAELFPAAQQADTGRQADF